MSVWTRIQGWLRRSPFLANVATMLSGTAVAQAIPMAMAPLLTRLYRAEDYGAYALFLLVAYTISALASLRYEFAIMLPDQEEEAASLVVLCFGLASAVSAIVLVATVVVRLANVEVADLSRLGIALYFLAPMVLLQSVYQTLGYWLLRKQLFRQLAFSRVFRAIAIAAANVALGVKHVGHGLVISSLLGQAIAVVVLAVPLVREDRVLFRRIELSRMWRLALEHRKFPLYALPADLLSTLSQQLPLMFFSQKLGGYFAFVQNVVNAPLGFVSGAVLDAFKERATRDFRDRREFRGIFVKLFRALALMSIAPTLVLILFGPPLFAFVFGEDWREGGEMARIMAIMVGLKFVASPLSYAYYVVGRTREDFVLHVWIVVSSAAALGYGVVVASNPTIAMWLFCINYSVVYVVYLVRSYRFALGNPGWSAGAPG